MERKIREEMTNYFYTPPPIVKKVFASIQWQSKVDKILLSFDDAPEPGSTHKILSFLNEKKIKAVFYACGFKSKRYPEIIEDIIDEGHILGNHTFNHRNMLLRVGHRMRQEILSVNELFSTIHHIQLEYFRPPFGMFNPLMLNFLETYKMKCIMWSLLTRDYKNDCKIVKFGIEKYLMKNSIVVFHDNPNNIKVTLEGIDNLLEKASEMNFEIGNPEGCLK